MCLSRAPGSRPVQPAMTIWSIASVSGVVVSWASTVKVRSNTNYGLHAGSKLEDTAVRTPPAPPHQAAGGLTLALRRQREGAAVGHVCQGGGAGGPPGFPR